MIDYEKLKEVLTHPGFLYVIRTDFGDDYVDITDDGVNALLRAIDLREIETHTEIVGMPSGEIIALANVRLTVVDKDGVERHYSSSASASSKQFDESKAGGKLRRYTLVQMAQTRARKDATILATGITRDMLEQRAKELGILNEGRRSLFSY